MSKKYLFNFSDFFLCNMQFLEPILKIDHFKKTWSSGWFSDFVWRNRWSKHMWKYELSMVSRTVTFYDKLCHTYILRRESRPYPELQVRILGADGRPALLSRTDCLTNPEDSIQISIWYFAKGAVLFFHTNYSNASNFDQRKIILKKCNIIWVFLLEIRDFFNTKKLNF